MVRSLQMKYSRCEASRLSGLKRYVRGIVSEVYTVCHSFRHRNYSTLKVPFIDILSDHQTGSSVSGTVSLYTFQQSLNRAHDVQITDSTIGLSRSYATNEY